MDVSIIIVNYNTIDILVNAIDSIFEKTLDLIFEVIVVDNNSTDNSKSILSEKYNSQIIYVSLSDNIGFGRANNEGIKIAKGRNIFFLNPDTILLNNAIKILSDCLDENHNIGACGGNLYDEDMKPAHSFRRIFPSIFLELNDLFFQMPERILFRNKEFNYSQKPIEVAYITGADLMVKSFVLNKVGSFNTSFFMYFEETELCWRIWKNKLKIVCIPESRIQHLEGRSFKSHINEKRIEMIENGRFIYYKTTYSSFYNTFIFFISFFNVRLRLFFYRIIDNPKQKYWSARLINIKKNINNKNI